MRWFAEYLESRENRHKLAKRLGIFLVIGSTLYTLLVVYYVIFLKK
jgi:hypothetical protein